MSVIPYALKKTPQNIKLQVKRDSLAISDIFLLHKICVLFCNGIANPWLNPVMVIYLLWGKDMKLGPLPTLLWPHHYYRHHHAPITATIASTAATTVIAAIVTLPPKFCTSTLKWTKNGCNAARLPADFWGFSLHPLVLSLYLDLLIRVEWRSSIYSEWRICEKK